ncbi:MAG: ATP-binding protein, partial [Gammaproteobacteria bacterium]|nr:ATP-binding protein [Gammaproteobacteria bacterium]
DYWKVGQHNTTSERSQFLGRYYAQGLLWAEDTSVRSEFSKLPGVFWFDQFRNLGSSSYSENHGDRKEDKGSDFGVGGLRKVLIQWNRRQASGLTDDYLTTLENFYQKIFPERSFNGIETMPSLNSVMEDEDFFVLNDGHHTYDIVEMSAGEQSILPILYEFVRKKIAYSIVLIDEIDLNLHPPAAQSLLRQLFKISPTCQFILTTHSEAITNVLSNNETYRLPGSSLCL